MTRKMVMDVKQRRPACVLLQAVWGGDRGLCQRFDSRSWLTFPTDDMQMIEGSDEQWQELIAQVNSEFAP